MSFYPGQHVVCIDDSKWAKEIDTPRKGEICTVRAVWSWRGEPCIRVEEHFARSLRKEKTPLDPDGEYWLQGECFRPLDEKRLDIFRVHLATSPKEREAT